MSKSRARSAMGMLMAVTFSMLAGSALAQLSAEADNGCVAAINAWRATQGKEIKNKKMREASWADKAQAMAETNAGQGCPSMSPDLNWLSYTCIGENCAAGESNKPCAAAAKFWYDGRVAGREGETRFWADVRGYKTMAHVDITRMGCGMATGATEDGQACTSVVCIPELSGQEYTARAPKFLRHGHVWYPNPATPTKSTQKAADQSNMCPNFAKMGTCNKGYVIDWINGADASIDIDALCPGSCRPKTQTAASRRMMRETVA